jgi:hypothetical protein
MMLNLEAEIDPTKWTAFQTEMCMNVALAKRDAFIAEAERVGDLVRLGLLARPTAADYLQTVAVYNALTFEYGTDAIQAIMAAALANEAAA